jgi:hypothetical protein
MSALDGANTEAVCVLGTTGTSYGTAVAATSSEDKLLCESIAITESVSELELNSIGSGQTMSADSERGANEAAFNITMKGGYHNAFPKLWAQFLGTSGTPSEQNGGEGDYLHQMTVNSTLNNVALSLAYESASNKVREAPSATISDMSLTIANAPDYIELTANGLANKLELSTSTNTNAVIAAAGEEDTERIIVERTDQIWINAQGGGALSSGDAVDCTSITLALSRPQNFISEMNGTAGNTDPVSGGLMTGTLTMVLKSSTNHTWEDAAQAGTEYKSTMAISGTTIGSGDPKTFAFFIPRMKPIVTPDYTVSDPGNNTKTVVFKILAAASNPTGMSSTLPYVEFTNEKSSAYIA